MDTIVVRQIRCPHCGASLRFLPMLEAARHIATCRATTRERGQRARMRFTDRRDHARENGIVAAEEVLKAPDWDWVLRFVVTHYTRPELAWAARVLGAPYAHPREPRTVLLDRLRNRWAEVVESARKSSSA